MQDDIQGSSNSGNLTITKQDLTRSVHRNVGLSKTDSAQMIDQIVSLITESLASGKNVKLSNFGTFQLINKAGRLGRNPKTNEEYPVAPRRVVTFKASSKLIQRVIKANADTGKLSSNQLSNQKNDVLSALGKKIGSEVCDLDFIFNSSTDIQVQNDVEIPDLRALNYAQSN